MYHAALIDNDPELFNTLKTFTDRYFDTLIAFHGPYEDASETAESMSIIGIIEVNNDRLIISTTQGSENGYTGSVTLPRDTPPIRICIALLAVIENFEIKDRGEMAFPNDANLTEREIEVLEYVSGGYSNGEIAGFMQITERTVKYHVSEILSKLKVSSRTEAVVEAARDGIITL